MMMRNIILATRGSKLALVQANMVKKLLEEKGASVTLKIVRTGGDKDQTSPLAKIGGKGLFVKEIELELMNGQADIAVHSGKDLPYQLAPGLIIGANPTPADPRDCLITCKGRKLMNSHERTEETAGGSFCSSPERTEETAGGSFCSSIIEAPVIGTGSPRRISECRRLMPNAIFKEIRGNVDTRLRKLKEGLYDGIFLAKAGMDRLELDLSEFDVRIFETNQIIPAACQGILAVECRQDDKEVLSLLQSISDPIAEKRFTLERQIFCALEADCSVAVGVHAELITEKNRPGLSANPETEEKSLGLSANPEAEEKSPGLSANPEAEEIKVRAMFQGRRSCFSCKSDQVEQMLKEIREKLFP